MLRNIKKRSEGFTIIEVLIVLAIAGLIMVIVFLAVPALQRNQRNNARNADGARIAAAVNECLANRNNVTTACDTDGEIEQGTMSQLTSISGTASVTSARIQFNRTCDSQGASDVAGTNARQFAVTYVLEPSVNRCIGSE